MAKVPGLYFVATPIGAGRDITLRALDVMREADILVAEDTRVLRRLLSMHDIRLAGRILLSYSDKSSPAHRSKILDLLSEGKSVAYLPDAGTPMVADPGFKLGQEAIAKGIEVFSVPGPSALLAALNVAGIPTDRFMFAGFLPSKREARRRTLRELRSAPSTLIFYEAARRLESSLVDIVEIMGGERQAAICREMTKRFETVVRGSLASVAEQFSGNSVKGEIVIVLDRQHLERLPKETIEELLEEAMQSMSLKDAASTVAERTGESRSRCYSMALAIRNANS